jgi:hypothetical protein
MDSRDSVAHRCFNNPDVPSEITRKPGPLTAAERREMNRHTIG